MDETALHQLLRDVKLTTVRRALSADCYRRSPLQTYGWLAIDVTFYLAMMAGVLVSDTAWARLAYITLLLRGGAADINGTLTL